MKIISGLLRRSGRKNPSFLVSSSFGRALPLSMPMLRIDAPRSSLYTPRMRLFETTSKSPSSELNGNKISTGTSMSASAMTDLFQQFSESLKNTESDEEEYLTLNGIRDLLESVGERPDEKTLRRIFKTADLNKDGKLQLDEFLTASDYVLGGAPARIIIVVGGPGSGKGILCGRLAAECSVVHLSGGDLLRDEVKRGTTLGKDVEEIMKRGELVSSAVMTTLIRKHMRAFPGQRVLLDGFPRSVENAADFLELMGTPELALHLECDDTILMERIIKRGEQAMKKAKDDGMDEDIAGERDADDGSIMKTEEGNGARSDDNFETALQRLRTFHKYHKPTMDWLKEQHVPIVHLDCSGTPENVWNQLLAIGRLMRPVAQLGGGGNVNANGNNSLNGNIHGNAAGGDGSESGSRSLSGSGGTGHQKQL